MQTPLDPKALGKGRHGPFPYYVLHIIILQHSTALPDLCLLTPSTYAGVCHSDHCCLIRDIGFIYTSSFQLLTSTFLHLCWLERKMSIWYPIMRACVFMDNPWVATDATDVGSPLATANVTKQSSKIFCQFILWLITLGRCPGLSWFHWMINGLGTQQSWWQYSLISFVAF